MMRRIGVLVENHQGLRGPLKLFRLKIEFWNPDTLIPGLESPIKDILHLAPCCCQPLVIYGESAYFLVETQSIPEDFEKMMKIRNWEIRRIGIVPLPEDHLQMAGDSFDLKRCTQASDGSDNGSNAEGRNFICLNSTEVKVNESKQEKNEEVFESNQHKEEEKIDEIYIIESNEDNGAGGQRELVELSTVTPMLGKTIDYGEI